MNIEKIDPQTIIKTLRKQGCMINIHHAIGLLRSLSTIKEITTIGFVNGEKEALKSLNRMAGFTIEQQFVLKEFKEKKGSKTTPENCLYLELLLLKFIIDDMLKGLE